VRRPTARWKERAHEQKFMRKTYPLIIVFLAGQVCTLAAAQNFEFSGMSLQLSPEDIKTRYPHSRPGEACVIEGFCMDVSPEDVRQDHIHFVNATKSGAVTTRIDLGFGAPSKPEAQASFAEDEGRHPACVDVRKSLVSKLGPWKHIVEYSEEALGQTAYTWCGKEQFMRLHCGRYNSRKPFFAENLAIGHTSTDRDAATLGGCQGRPDSAQQNTPGDAGRP
jgi:hypothetical protein